MHSILLFFIVYPRIHQVLGPRLMENRKPFELRKVLIVYNFLQVLFSSWLFYEASSTGWFAGYSYRCQPVDYSRTPLAMRVSVKHFRNITIWKCLLKKQQEQANGRCFSSRSTLSTFAFIYSCLCACVRAHFDKRFSTNNQKFECGHFLK